MSLIQWSDSYRVGHTMLDYDHMTLVNITNQVWDLRHSPSVTNAEIARCIQQLADYTKRHFQREEEIFSATDYPDVEAHKAMHRELETTVDSLVLLLRREPDMMRLDEIADFLKRWLLQHIAKHDRAYSAYLDGARKVA